MQFGSDRGDNSARWMATERSLPDRTMVRIQMRSIKSLKHCSPEAFCTIKITMMFEFHRVPVCQ
jgi:hypothetical protein